MLFVVAALVVAMVGCPLGGRRAYMGTSMSNDAVMQPEQVMEALLGRQRVLRALLDECAFRALTRSRVGGLSSSQAGANVLVRVCAAGATPGRVSDWATRLPCAYLASTYRPVYVFSPFPLPPVTEHQRTAAHIAHLTATLSSTSAALAALHTSLSSAEASLQVALDAARPRLAAAAAAAAHPLPVADLIASGARLAPAIAAPPGWAPPQPLGGSVPPAVTDEAMRAGRLASLAGGVFAPPGGDGGATGGGAADGVGAEDDADGSSDSDSDEEGSL